MKSSDMSEAYKKKLIKYLFQCLGSELSKIILFSIIFINFHVFEEFLFALLLLILLRTNGGGLHFKNYMSCFVMSLCVFVLSIYLGNNIILSKIISILTLAICIPIGYKLVPVVSANRPPARNEIIKKSKHRTLAILLCYMLIVCFLPINRFLNTGVWIIYIHISQLSLAKFLERRRNICGTN